MKLLHGFPLPPVLGLILPARRKDACGNKYP